MDFLGKKNPLSIESDKCIIKLDSLENSEVKNINKNIFSNIKFDNLQAIA